MNIKLKIVFHLTLLTALSSCASGSAKRVPAQTEIGDLECGRFLSSRKA